MCGIVGFTGRQNAAPILLDGLKKLEYRGYDSAGIAVMDRREIRVNKVRGRIANYWPSRSATIRRSFRLRTICCSFRMWMRFSAR